MSPILSTILFASAAAAQITTSLWLPSLGTSDEQQYNFEASVIASKGDDITMAVGISGDEYPAETITFHGSTAFENIITTSDVDGSVSGDMTYSYGCTQQGKKPICVASSNGPAVWSLHCDAYTEYADFTSSLGLPDYCMSGSLLPESVAVTSISLDETEVQTYAVTITAGEAKLGATAGATPTNSGASPTRTPTGSLTRSTTGSTTTSPTGGNNSAGPASTPSGSAPPAEQSKGAAAPMVTLAPALAGMGALVAAFL
jgi:hypothetical protein